VGSGVCVCDCVRSTVRALHFFIFILLEAALQANRK
jgi:hypothetical protein